MIRYEHAADIERAIKDIIEKLGMKHIDVSRIRCMRSFGSGSRYTIARCHALPRIMQKALDLKAHYFIEVISERFDSMDEQERMKTLIHELMHIPKSFRGGFRHHRPYVNRPEVEKMYRKYVQKTH